MTPDQLAEIRARESVVHRDVMLLLAENERLLADNTRLLADNERLDGTLQRVLRGLPEDLKRALLKEKAS